MVDCRKLLLGDDFVRFCDFSHRINGDIFIEDFHNEAYDVFNGCSESSKYIYQDEILDMVNSCRD